MIVNETEAKTKWCPYAHGKGGVNRADAGDTVLTYGLCIASECMAWRETSAIWKDPRGTRWPTGGDARVKIQSSGYCGAFGRPEGLDSVEGIK